MASKRSNNSGTLTIDDVNETLDNSLKEIFESDRFEDMLNVMSKVPNYSLNNKLLIVAQKPDATMVMGYNQWKQLGRNVSKGESALTITAPIINKREVEDIDPATNEPNLDENGNVVKKTAQVKSGYRPVKVFDVQQTEGKEIPNVRDFIVNEMEADDYTSKLYNDYLTYLTNTKGEDIREDATDQGVGGYFNRATNEIVISNTENDNDNKKFRVLIHEYAHSKLHNMDSEMKDLERGHKEAQAESAAYVVSNYFGFDTSSVSSGYIATWSQDVKLARQALSEVQDVANQMIDEINLLQKEKINEFYQSQNKDYESAKEMLIKEYGLPEEVFDPSEKRETQLQLINTQNGYMLSGKLEFNEKNDNFYLRTNRNMIEPLSELSENGNLEVLNVEKELGKLKEHTSYSRIPSHYEVKKLDNGPYVVQSSNGEDVISKEFEKRKDAEEFYMRSSLAQSLHQNTFFKRELKTSELQQDLNGITNDIEKQVNAAVSDYLSNNSEKKVSFKANSGISIGWALLKNPKLKTFEQVQEFAEKNQHVPGYKQLKSALENTEHSEKNDNGKSNKPKETKIVEEKELVIER